MHPGLHVMYGPRGRGVMTALPIPQGKVVEVAPAIDRSVTGLDDYVFVSPVSETDGICRLVLGYGMLYSHSDDPNMGWEQGATYVTFYALRDIAPGEELTIDYQDSERWFRQLHIEGEHG